MARLLVVDDESQQRHLQRLLLEKSGHDVHTAGSAVEAARLLPEIRPDVLLMDLRLPELRDGLGLISAAGRQPHAPKIIVLAGWPADLEGHPEEHLVACVLAKPLRIDRLLHAIREVLLAPGAP